MKFNVFNLKINKIAKREQSKQKIFKI